MESSITHDGTDVTFTLRVNGNLEVNRTETTSAIDTNLNMFLFAQNKGGAADLKSSVRCYGVKIWQDGELVRDFRPCVKNGCAGLYDAVSDAVFYPSAGTLAAGPVTRLHGKPDHFIQYVEATGSQYIDTGVIGRCNSAMEAHVLWNYVGDGIFLASRIDSGNTRFILYGAAGRHYMAHRTYTQSTDSTRKGSVSGSPLVEWNLEAPDYISSWMKVNGTTRINQTRTEEGIDTGLNMYLFAQNMGGSSTYYSPVRCFDLKITQDGALVRDFRPCLKNGRAGLYDEVSGWIFFPQGGELVYPNETPDRFVKWANAPGANYVPVAVRAKSGVRAEMKFRPEGTALELHCDRLQEQVVWPQLAALVAGQGLCAFFRNRVRRHARRALGRRHRGNADAGWRRRGAWRVRHGPRSLHVRGQYGRKRAGLLHGPVLLHDDRRVRRDCR